MSPELCRLHRLRLPEAGAPLFEAIAKTLPGLSRSQARKALVAGLVTVAGRPAGPRDAVPAAGAACEVDLRHGLRAPYVRVRHGAPPPDLRLGILHLDEQMCVVDKPAGVASVPAPEGGPPTVHVGELLRRQLRRQGRTAGFLGLVHRLDRDTSGCLAVALTREAQRMLAAQFAGEAAVRTYRCLVCGQPREEAGEVRGKQGRGEDGRRALVEAEEPGVEAVTHWRVLRRLPGHAELEVRLGTGRTHQVRVAMAALGCPVLGDRVYGRGAARAARLMLHAASLELDHPRTGARLRVESPLPDSWRQVAAGLG